MGAELVDGVFANPGGATGLETLLAVYGYALQIYGDFSGYSDIAIGVALLLGFRFPDNFNQPYRALSLQDFWRRWHISLSSWLRDYLYIGLGGNQGGRARTARNLLVTMLLGGLWHGAGWTFILWGAIHGVGLVIERFVPLLAPARHTGKLGQLIRRVAVFHVVCAGWIFFRAVDLPRALEVFGSLGGSWTSAPSGARGVLALLTIGAMTQVGPRGRFDGLWERAGQIPVVLQAALVATVFVILNVFGPDGVAPFLYFAF